MSSSSESPIEKLGELDLLSPFLTFVFRIELAEPNHLASLKIPSPDTAEAGITSNASGCSFLIQATADFTLNSSGSKSILFKTTIVFLSPTVSRICFERVPGISVASMTRMIKPAEEPLSALNFDLFDFKFSGIVSLDCVFNW